MSESVWKQGVQGSGPAVSHEEQQAARRAAEADQLPALRSLVGELLDSIATRDWERFQACFHSTAVLFDRPDETGYARVSNLPEALDDLRTWFDGQAVGTTQLHNRVTLRNLDFDLREDIALVNLKGGKDQPLKRMLVLMREKDDERWLVRHFHAPAVFSVRA